MDERQKRRFFQKVKTLTNDHFWQQMNVLHSRAYYLGQKHIREAMECMPGISKKQIEAVMSKAVEIQEQWEKMPTITVDATEDKL